MVYLILITLFDILHFFSQLLEGEILFHYTAVDFDIGLVHKKLWVLQMSVVYQVINHFGFNSPVLLPFFLVEKPLAFKRRVFHHIDENQHDINK